MRSGRAELGLGAPERVSDRGSVTAEFAVALPAVLLLLTLLLGAVRLAGLQLVAQDAAADAARSLGRGDGADAVRARLERQLPGARLSSSSDDGLVCASVEAPTSGPAALLGLRPAARSCALDGGR